MILVRGAGRCGTIDRMRWLLVLAFVVLGSRDAGAQAFKTRGKPAATKPAKKTTAKKAKKRTKKKVRKSRIARQARADDLTPDAEAPKKLSPEDEDDYVVITDDDE
jgi:hypothetical protein